jgi:hypothetical protein
MTENSPSFSPEPDRIRKALETTGFPLELQVSEILRRRRYEIYGNQFYEVGDKIKEIDMEALIPARVPESDKIWCLNPEIVIECKMSKKYCWVFHRNYTVVGHFELAQAIDIITLRHGYVYRRLGEILRFQHYYDSHVATTFAVLDVEKGRLSDRDEIFDSVSKLNQFVKYRVEGLMEYFSGDRRDIIFFFPVIVFDGMIYEADHKAGKLSILPIDSIVLETRTLSPITGQVKLACRDLSKKATQTRLKNDFRSPGRRRMQPRTQRQRTGKHLE